MQNIVQQQAPMQHHVTQQSALHQLQQQVPNQQHQIIQQGTSQQQTTLTHQHSNQQQHLSKSQIPGYQMPTNHGLSKGQRIVSAANSSNLPIQQDMSNTGDFAPVSQQNKAARPNSQDGSVSSATDHSTITIDRVGGSSLEQQEENSQHGSVGALEGPSIDTNVDSKHSNEICAAELRKLDQDFENNLKRAKKVFVNRMDNLQRTQVQREARHQKTLEQHQKDRAAFEKRLQQEEIEQNRRIEQMQKEWDRRREEVRSKDQIG